jgi:hypothetical protein
MIRFGGTEHIHNKTLTKLFVDITRNREYIDKFTLRVGNYIVGEQSFGYRVNDFNKIELFKSILKHPELKKLIRDEFMVKVNLFEDRDLLLDNKQLINQILTDIVSIITSKGMIENLKNGKIEYKTADCGRNYNELQTLPRSTREFIFSDILPYHADMDNAYFTILTQEAIQIMESGHNFTTLRKKRMGSALELVSMYLNNKEYYRELIATTAKITVDEAKEILIGVVNGARISPTMYSPIFKRIFGGHEYFLYKLLNLPFYREFRKACKQIWDLIFTYREKLLGIETPKSKKQKHDIYFAGEKKVRDAVFSFIRKQDKKALYVDEHDGFRCNVEIIKEVLEDWVFKQTGWNCSFSVKWHNKSNFSSYSLQQEN